MAVSLKRSSGFSGAMAAGLLVAMFGLASCTGSNTQVASVSALNGNLAEGYQIGPGDKIKVTVFDEVELSGEYEIGDSGALAMPLLEEIQAAGKSPSQLAQNITHELESGGYVLAPRVSIEVLEYRPFYILGQVNNPGEYPYSGDLTLAQAVAKAGGYTARANKGTVELQRQQWPSSRRVKLDNATLMIAPGDTIMVPEAFF